jgi:D-alanyl-D-alanine carboxypeptidase (penicillin-binding protein 5/6)
MNDGPGRYPTFSGSARVVAPSIPAARTPPDGTLRSGPNPPSTKKASTKKRPRWIASLIVVLLVLGALATGVAVQLDRALPQARLTASVAATLRIPGAAVKMPWPAVGSAELMIEGLGRLGGSGASRPKPIGSVAKVMTAYLILKDHPLTGTDPGPSITVTAADVADYHARIPSGQSLVAVAAGEVLTERQALEALLLPSANNVAHLLGVWDAGSAGAFVTKMNDAAADLGLTGSKYTDPSGFLPSTVSTAADQVTLARAALKLPVFADLVAERSARIPVAGQIKNYNDLLGVGGVFGIKTGSTDQAGGNLVFAARLKVGGRTLTVVGAVFNQPGANTPQQLAKVNSAVRKLLAAVRSAVRVYTLLAAKPLGQVTTAWGDTVTVSPARPVKVVGWPGQTVPVTLTKVAPGAEVTTGQVVGSITARPGATTVRVELHADSTTGDPTLWWKLKRKP